MYEWNEMVQRMIDWVEEDLAASPTLLEMSKHLGYSPYYCTRQFHVLTGMTLRDYVWQRRIGRAALELRDTDVRILDIAVKFGFFFPGGVHAGLSQSLQAHSPCLPEGSTADSAGHSC
ncbi:helix-turn-helix domain-containing protein [Paenibacillus rhizoplanae]